jgi:hypothetical protein
VALLIHEGFIRPAAQTNLLFAAMALLAVPDLYRFDRWVDRLREWDKATDEPADEDVAQ